METQQITGTWRSYKTFSARGDMKLHEVNCYQELAISGEGELVIRSFSSITQKRVLKKDAWQIISEGRRHFLFLEGKKTFEVITLERDQLVLQDPVSGEKVFFLTLPLWQQCLQPRKDNDQHMDITLWSKSLIKLITLEK